MGETTRLTVVGIGMGPQHVTPEAAEVLRRASYVLALDKSATPGAHAGAGTDEQLAVRRAVADQFSLEVVAVPDPPRDRDDPSDYRAAVAAWHAARVDRLAAVLTERPGHAVVLAWGDPSLYDSLVRLAGQVAERLALDWDVVPGISAPQLLAARHRIVLHGVGEPVHITPARRLPQAIRAGQRTVLVMLTAEHTLDELAGLGIGDWQVWWAANLGDTSERLVAGPVGEVLDELRAARAAARDEAGWVMDIFLLRAPEPVR